MPADDRFREILRGLTVPSEPTDEQKAKARAALHQAYRSEEARRRPRRRWRPSIGWAAAAVAAAVAAVVVITVPGSTPAVDANLAEIARVARTLTAEELPAGAYVYVRSESTVLVATSFEEDGPAAFYLLPTTVDEWVRGTAHEQLVTVGSPTFFNPAHEEEYYASGQAAADRVGETYVERLGDAANIEDISRWSADVDVLRDQLDAELSLGGGDGLADQVRSFEAIVQLMGPDLNAPPELRAALIEVLATLDITTEMVGDSVRVTLQSDEVGRGLVRRELDIDTEGFMVRTAVTVVEPSSEFPVPAGTVISLESFSRPSIVDGPGVFPG